ncbi:MAG: bifunctional demethylmenaquinone methyltransferase/2-methoxy-6-polyprenyl-1,4-benzoquinol methylase UbiE [Chromatiales bacterium]|nr:bifunctional demethylmenaquinone methyltransferase/2-methoxy-6-polyprenyl-1,4-benzoquinol methylase UbiE [Chromatiales bacterium]
MNERTTDFGYETVGWDDKARRVAGVFDSVAGRYDVMNDLMSFGQHRIWKRIAIDLAAVREGQRVLDLAGGTGDLTRQLARRVGRDGLVCIADINARMLERGRERLLDSGDAARVRFALANAERLPFASASFDCVTIAFGLRNVTDKPAALAEMHRVLRPGGRLIVLEFSRPRTQGLRAVYDAYSFGILPALGRLVAGDAESYRYLAESIRMHPDQETLAGMVRDAGFVDGDWLNLAGGIVAIHRGFVA